VIARQPATRVDIPDSCAMQGDFTPDTDLQFWFGERENGVAVTFERSALERFIHLAVDMLATPLPDDDSADGPSPDVRRVA
jgi:hypothetical protein